MMLLVSAEVRSQKQSRLGKETEHRLGVIGTAPIGTGGPFDLIFVLLRAVDAS